MAGTDPGVDARLFGEIAVGKGFITPFQLEAALGRQQSLGVPLGEALVELGFATPSQVAAILKLQRLLLIRDEIRERTGQQAAPDPLLGELLGGCVILEEIGRGAMGTTYRAHHLRLDRDVCVKVLNPELSRDKRTVERFTREARAAARLDHTAIVSVYDFDVTERCAYMVLQLVDGISLKEVLEKRGALGPKRAAYVGSRIADALAAAHRENIVHRDVKPANVLVSKKGQIKLTDFGLVGKIDPEPGDRPESGAELIGTPNYMSPEQGQALPGIDGRSDVYSLGIMLFELASGELPFEATTLVGLLKKHMLDPLPSLRAVCRDAPPELDLLLSKLCAKEPAARPDAATAARELRALSRAAFGADTGVFESGAWPVRGPKAGSDEAKLAELETDLHSKRDVLEAAGDKLVARAVRGELAEALRQAQRLSPTLAREITDRVLATLGTGGRFVEIVAAGRTIEELAPQAPRSLVALAHAHRALGQLDLAEQSLTRAVHFLKEDAEVALELAQTRAALGQRDEAREAVNALLAQRPLDPGVHRSAAELLYVVLADREHALEVCARWGEIDKAAPEPRQLRGSILLELGRAPEATKALEEAIARVPGSAPLHELLARARLQKGDALGARAAFKRALELDPHLAVTRRALVEDAIQGSQWEEAARLAGDGLKQKPDDVSFQVGFALARERLGDYPAAARVYANVLAKDRENAAAREGMSRLRKLAGGRAAQPEPETPT